MSVAAPLAPALSAIPLPAGPEARVLRDRIVVADDGRHVREVVLEGPSGRRYLLYHAGGSGSWRTDMPRRRPRPVKPAPVAAPPPEGPPLADGARALLARLAAGPAHSGELRRAGGLSKSQASLLLRALCAAGAAELVWAPDDPQDPLSEPVLQWRASGRAPAALASSWEELRAAPPPAPELPPKPKLSAAQKRARKERLAAAAAAGAGAGA